MLPFTREELDQAILSGRVTARRHPTLPYTIYNYSPEVQYTNYWDDVTLNCRGLILDDDFNIVARPWKKFFNLGQVELPIQFDTPVEVMDKMDGSLGILYPIVIDRYDAFDIHYGIATRGSFESPQAEAATKLFREKYPQIDPIPGYTMLFEIIFPWNRIVLNYGDTEDLVLLGAVENSTGYYISPTVAKTLWHERGHLRGPFEYHWIEWPGPVVEVMEHKTLSDAIGDSERPNAEGFVIRSHNFMVKLKQADYLELHRLVTNASPKTCWEQLKAGKSKSEIISNFPDEFHSYIESMVDPLIEQFDARLATILDGFAATKYRVDLTCSVIPREPTRADYAREFKKSRNAKYYFLLLDNRPIRDVLWAELKPRESAIERIESD